jgi:hypothetical protein
MSHLPIALRTQPFDQRVRLGLAAGADLLSREEPPLEPVAEI